MNLRPGSGLRSRIRRKTRHATGRPMDARPDPDHGLPGLRLRSTPRSSPGPRYAPAWRHRGVGFSGGRWSARIRGVGRGASGPNRLSSRPVRASPAVGALGRAGSCCAAASSGFACGVGGGCLVVGVGGGCLVESTGHLREHPFYMPVRVCSSVLQWALRCGRGN